MGWNKRSSGRRYDSPSGVSYMLGVIQKKKLLSAVMVRKCTKCDILNETKNELSKQWGKHPLNRASNCLLPLCSLCFCESFIQSKIMKLETHVCIKNCGKNSVDGISAKGMEPCGTVRLVNLA